MATDQQARSVAAILARCAGVTDARMLRIRVIEGLRERVAFDNYAWLLTDPRTSVGSDPLADVPSLRDLPLIVKLKYLTDVNRWTELAASGIAARSLAQRTAGDLAASRLWGELQSGMGVIDVLSVVFADRYGCWGFLDLWRTAPALPFSDPEVALLAGSAAGLTEALRTCQAETFQSAAVPQRRQPGPVVLLLDDNLTVGGQTAATQTWLQTLIPGGNGRPAIPASVYNVAAQLLAAESGIDGNEAAARVHLSDGYWLTLRAARLGVQTDTAPTPIAVTLEETAPDDRLDIFGRAVGLSPRESQLLALLATGNDTRQLAQQLVVSENTIQDHLKSIFAKTGSRNRSGLMSRALGTQPPR